MRVYGFAMDDEGNDISDRLTWESAPPMPGGGTGELSIWTPDKPGHYVVTARLPTAAPEGGGLEAPSGGGSSANIYVWEDEIEKLVIDKSPQLRRVREGKRWLGTDHYVKNAKPAPAVIAVGTPVTAKVTLKIGPLPKDAGTLTIVAIAKDEGMRLLTLKGEKELSGDFEGEIQLEGTPNGKLGTANSIEWTMELRGQVTMHYTPVKIFFTAAAADVMPKHSYYEEIFDWACGWTRGLDPGDPKVVLDRLFERRADSQLMFSYAVGSGQGLEGMIQVGRGECGEMARYILALAAVHGIAGDILWLHLLTLPDDPRRWVGMFVSALALNNDTHDGLIAMDGYFMLEPGMYNGDDSYGLLRKASSYLSQRDVWQYNHHQMGIFTIGGKNWLYDVSPQAGEIHELTKAIGDHVLEPTDDFRTGIVDTIIAYVIGNFPVQVETVFEGEPRIETDPNARVVVDAREVSRRGENLCIRLERTSWSGEP